MTYGRKTSLVYIEKDGRYLILHRTKKGQDENHDKWIGVGGKFEPGEAPDDCALREAKEETGLTLTDFALRGLIIFVSDVWGHGIHVSLHGDEMDGPSHRLRRR